ncbi:T9SS type A sorting domain-containing protein [Lewinella sp. IMCC34191]|uniref:T9SS type A sorting domain-containing protein n=1 Tax=Lewinella sp. IMCC34191 TaxID=2259172 RepID=UPI000E2867F9|nr:T9SS type A sorting domain-containing protein [Lewinella sp. IMCC34191]
MPKILLSIGLLFTALAVQAQVVYVDADATGANNGSSWADAYSDLMMALDSADAGSDLWIAAGTYVTPDTSAFFIDRELSLYGGFAGTETEATAADPAANVVVLSGDIDGNDIAGSYDSLLAVDNNRVLEIIDTAATSRFTVTIDGVTISHGVIAADFPGDTTLIPYAGGGIYSEAKTAISRTVFTDNRASFGSATAQLFATAIGSSFDNITSEGNHIDMAGAHYVRATDSISFTNSSFTGTNGTNPSSGFIEVNQANNLMVDNCSFSNLQGSASASGAAILFINSIRHRISNSTFTNLSAYTGGALYATIDGSLAPGLPANMMDFVVEDCTFDNVTSEAWGGAIFLNNMSHRITGSSFTDGAGAVSAGLGGALYFQNSSTQRVFEAYVDDCQFLRNVSGGAGGAIFYFADTMDVSISNSLFQANSSGGAGGAVFIQGTAGVSTTETMVTNCDFFSNSAPSFGGAALFLSEKATVAHCEFTNNQSNNGSLYLGSGGKTFRVVKSHFNRNGGASTGPSMVRGAAIWAGLDAGILPDTVMIDSCKFEGNTVTSDEFISGGGAIYASGNAGLNPLMDIRNSAFLGNTASEAGGGAIEVVNGLDLRVYNTDFLGNSGASAGGAINFTRTVVRDTIDNVPIVFYNTDDEPRLTIERGLFVVNSTEGQGGAINLFSSSIDMRNSLLIGNRVEVGGGSGGGLIINGSNIVGAELDNYLVNNTFYNNLDAGSPATNDSPASVGNAVALYQPGGTNADTNSITLTLQNNAFVMEARDEESLGFEENVGDTEDETGFGAISVISLGGNFFNNELSDYLEFTTEQDIVDTDVSSEDIFVDPLQDDRESEYPNVELLDVAGNPLVDAGTTGELVPEIDLYGNTRDELPDIGALELGSVAPVGVAEPIERSGLDFEFFPNPAVEALNIINRDAGVRDFTVLLSDAQGRLISSRRYNGERNVLPVSQLPAGVYNLTLIVNQQVYSKQFLKR